MQASRPALDTGTPLGLQFGRHRPAPVTPVAPNLRVRERIGGSHKCQDLGDPRATPTSALPLRHLPSPLFCRARSNSLSYCFCSDSDSNATVSVGVAEAANWSAVR